MMAGWRSGYRVSFTVSCEHNPEKVASSILALVILLLTLLRPSIYAVISK